MAPSRTPSELMAMMVMRMGSRVYSQLFSLPDEGPPAPEVGEEELLQSPSYSSMAQNTQDCRHGDIIAEVPQPLWGLTVSSRHLGSFYVLAVSFGTCNLTFSWLHSLIYKMETLIKQSSGLLGGFSEPIIAKCLQPGTW